MQPKSNLKLKYCPILDSFIKIKELAKNDIDRFLSNAKIRDKRSYQELVIRATIPEFSSNILYRIHDDYENSFDSDSILDELYRMCIKVNPFLNIYNITIPVPEQTEKTHPVPQEEKKNLQKRIEEIRGLQEALRKRVVGQDEAIAQVARSIQCAKIGIKDPNRPVGCFIFAGQTGVGKTELAKAVAEFITGDEKNMVRIDCSEFSQPHEYSKLIGAPPGYVGYEDGGTLTETLLNNPNNVVLFDEIEKASPKLHNLLLQIMDEGFLTDSKGRKIPFQDAVVILTSNVGVEGLDEMKKAVGYRKTETFDQEIIQLETRKALEKTFRPEFLNRVDQVICFRALDRRSSRKIVRMLLKRIEKDLSEMDLSLRFTGGAIDYLIRKGTDRRYGARPLKRAIKQFVETPLTQRIVEDPTLRPGRLLARMSGGKLVFIRDRETK